ncbi:NIPSNAP family protein [Aquabacterium sp.]|uniref:NIPSNAP family protein n=1 Tax=Aquabacterium sp. TaxID=1872578 RepID=UPI002CDCCA1C|nr:NIPSNAP family protein [Aquabacterium sp.]HSW05840.1 NIPSNAP family protein [Aquabacterium sp.]
MSPSTALPAVIELRQYALHPGQRDALINLFEREFIAPQQACGMQLLGQFHDLADADRFVWLRGFADMPARAQALADFYGGPVWQAHRNEANATMIDSDNVLLLRPCVGLPQPAAVAPGGSAVFATLCPLRTLADDALRRCVAEQLLPRLQQPGVRLLAVLETEPAANTFPRLPVREGEPMLAWLMSVDDGVVPPLVDTGALLDRWLRDLPQTLSLRATPHSAWR